MTRCLRIGARLLIVCHTLSACSFFGRSAANHSVLPLTVPRSEACISGSVSSSGHVNASGATVSLASVLIPPKARRAYERADEALTRHAFDVAEKELNEAISISPKSAVAWCLIGTLHEEQLQLDEAFAAYSQALRADSEILPAYLGLARIAFRENEWQEVIKFTDQLVNINPVAFPAAYLYNAAAHFNLGTLAAAETSARRFQSLDTEHERPQVYLLLGDILAREHDYLGAAEQKSSFLTIDPNADDANDIKEQIRIFEHYARGTQ
jgi:tetratricopeptide (TPR) repeat protein